MSNNQLVTHNDASILEIPSYHTINKSLSFKLPRSVFSKYEIYETITKFINFQKKNNTLITNNFYYNNFKWKCIFNDVYLQIFGIGTLRTEVSIQLWKDNENNYILEFNCLCGDRKKVFNFYRKLFNLFDI